MHRAALRRILLLLSMLIAPAITFGATDPTAPPALKAETVLTDLQQRIDELQRLLTGVRAADGEPQRQPAMLRHWTEMQDYMAASLARVVREPGTAATDCRVIAGTWKGLPFPGHIRSDDYLKAMQGQMDRMRGDLASLRAVAQDPEALDAALRSQWQANYQFLQSMRGLDWMFSGWTPDSPGDRTLPDSQSEGAQLTSAYCSSCHAVPDTRLHSAEEWNLIMSKMAQHITRSDSSFPVCVRIPTAAELQAISDYLVKYAR